MKTFVVYNSSAGSGKTFTLAKEYLKIVLDEPSKVSHVLALTFTNKAAGEMKDRILKNLSELSKFNGHKDNDTLKFLLPVLVEETGLGEFEISRRSDEVLADILHNYSGFSVATIDSFMHRIVRTFAYDLNIPQNFEIETDSDTLLEEAVDLLVDKAGEDEGITKLLVEFALHNTDDSKSWNIEADLYKDARILLKEDSQEFMDKLKTIDVAGFQKISARLSQWLRKFRDDVTSNGKKAADLIKSRSINPAAFAGGEKSGVARYFYYLSEFEDTKLMPTPTHLKTFNDGKWIAGKASKEDISAIESIQNELMAIYQEVNTIVERDFKKYSLFKLLQHHIYPLSALSEIDKILGVIKDENNIKLISEFNKLISGIVIEQPVPFIYERVGEKYHHYLIDEFQDTSVMQWQNLLPLIDNSLASGNFNMIVGDGKQAIYRWRSGEVEQFVCLPNIYNCPDNHFKEIEQNLNNYFEGRQLNANFRSKEGIVTFNNEFFRYSADNFLAENLKIIYKSLEQNFIPSKKGGYVHIEFVEKQEEEPVNPLLSNAEKFALAYDDRVLGVVNEVRTMNYAWSDIAILCRRNSEASRIANFLLTNNIPVVSSESLLLSSSSEVNFIISLLYLLSNPQDEIQKASVIRYLHNLNGLSAESLHDSLFDNIKLSLDAIVGGFGYVVNSERLEKLSVYEQVEQLIFDFGLNKLPNPYIQFFLDHIFQFVSRRLVSLPEVLEWWEEKRDSLSIIIPEQTNAIRIMTIHKSKGLQFPVVIYPYADDSVSLDKGGKFIELKDSADSGLPVAMVNMEKRLKESEEYGHYYAEEESKAGLDLLNMLYVALTRPEDQLYILTRRPFRTTPIGCGTLFIEYLKNCDVYEDSKNVFTFGEPNIRAIIDKKNEDDGKSVAFISNDWKKRVILAASSYENWINPENQSYREYGIALHAVLSAIRTASDVETVVDRAVLTGDLSEDRRADVLEKVKSVVYHPELEKLYSDDFRILNEAEILTPQHESHRPDRILIKDNEAIILEFKTGKESKKHIEQITGYAKLLEQMGFKVKRKLLVYVGVSVNVIDI